MTSTDRRSRPAAVLAVLPFRGADGAADDGLPAMLAEALTGALTRVSQIEVIAAQSARAVAELPEAEAAARLGADYLLSGRMAAFSGALALRVTLVAGADALAVWQETLTIPDDDPLAAIDEVTARLAATFSARVAGDVLRRSRDRAPETLEGFELIARGAARLKAGTREADEEARALFARVLERNPDSAAALGGMALSWFNEWSCDFWSEFEAIGARAYDYAHRALALDDRDPWLHLILARILLYRRDYARAAWYMDRALALAPNDAELLIQMVPAEVYLGRPEAAQDHAAKAMRLNPYHPNHYFAYAAFPPFVMRDFENALAVAERAAGVMIIDIPAFSAIACAHLGRHERAQRFLALFEGEFRRRITRDRAPASGEALAWLLDYNPFRRAEDIALVREGLALLGGAAAPPAPPSEPMAAALRHATGQWRIAYAGRQATLPELRGLEDLARLLARPGEAVHCLDLAGRPVEEGSVGEALDEQARVQIKARIRALQEDLAEAEDMNDLGRAERARAERDRLVETLSAALGLGGRGRRLGDGAERARSAVTWRIRHAIRRVTAVHPELGRHLQNAVRTGTFCSYQPERPCRWQVGAEATA